jgi:CHAT domain-containing protein
VKLLVLILGISLGSAAFGSSIDSLHQSLSSLNQDNSEKALDRKSVICNEIAIYYQGISAQEKARTFFLQAIYFMEDKVDTYHLNDAQSFYDLGFLYSNLATFESTLQNYEQALAHMKKAEHNYQQLQPLLPADEYKGLLPRFYQTFGVIAYHSEKYEDAIGYFDEALKWVSSMTSTGALSLRRMKGESYSGMKKYDEAIAVFEACLHDILEEELTKVNFQHYLHSLLAAEYHAGYFEKIIDRSSSDGPYNLMNILDSIETRDYDEASSILDNVFILSFVYTKMGDRRKDVTYYQKAYAWQKQGLQLAEVFTLQTDGEKLGSIINNSKNKVLALLTTSVKLTEAQLLAEEEVIQLIRIVDVYQSAKLHMDRLSHKRNKADWKQEKELRNELNYLHLSLDNEVNKSIEDTAAQDSLRTIIYEKSIQLSALTKTTKTDKILAEYKLGQEKFGDLLTAYLQKGEKDLLIYFHTVDSDSLFVLGRQNSHYFIEAEEVSAKFVDQIAENYRYNSTLQFSRQNMTAQNKSNQLMYDDLWKSVHDRGLQERVLIYPMHELSYINFEALLDEKETYVLQHHEIHYASSLFSLIQPKIKTKEAANFYSFYPTAYGTDSLADLFYASNEVDALSQVLQAKSYVGDRADKQRFIELSTFSKGIHIASHSILNKNHPYDSYILFNENDTASNKLFAYEVFSMSITSEMIALSSCNSSQGTIQEGIGALSLANAFYFAGIPSTISSMWSAQDKSSSQIMVEFYKALGDGMSKTKSLRQAKLHYLNGHDHMQRQPFFWANYVLYGDDAAIYEAKNELSLWWWIGSLGIVITGGFGYYKYRKRAVA